jgi:hypothetical protein
MFLVSLFLKWSWCEMPGENAGPGSGTSIHDAGTKEK